MKTLSKPITYEYHNLDLRCPFNPLLYGGNVQRLNVTIMKIDLCRTQYCPICAANGRPYMGDVFVLYGRTSGNILIDECQDRVKARDYGFTPHLLTILDRDLKNKQVVIEKVCAMHGCGITLYETDEEENYEFVVNRKSITLLSLKQWNDLVKFSDTGYHI